jgi:hypothetical protein
VRQNSPHKNRLAPEVDFRNQSVMIAFDVEHGALADAVGVRKILLRINDACPVCATREPVPDVEWRFRSRMFLRELPQGLPADHMHRSTLSPVVSLPFTGSQIENQTAIHDRSEEL